MSKQEEKMLIQHIKTLFSDHENLQLEHAILRRELNEKNAMTGRNQRTFLNHRTNSPSTSTDIDLKQQLENTEALLSRMKEDNVVLMENLKVSLQRYSDLATIVGREEGATVIQTPEQKAQLDDANAKCAALDKELKDLKENFEFINSENQILQESIKELENSVFKERFEWRQEKKNYDEALEYPKQLYVKHKKLEETMAELEKEAAASREKLVKLEIVEKEHRDILSQLKLLLNDQAQEELKNSEPTPQWLLQKISDEFVKLEQDKNILESKNQELKKLLETQSSIDVAAIAEENGTLKAQLDEQIREKDIISDKYIRHRLVMENNEKNFEAEMEKLDGFVSGIFSYLKSLPEDLKARPELMHMLKLYDNQTSNS